MQGKKNMFCPYLNKHFLLVLKKRYLAFSLLIS